MILALLEGTSTPEQIAGLARGQAQRKIPQLIEALEGHRMNDHCALVIRSSLRHLGCLQEEIETVDDEIPKRMRTPPFEAAFALLQTIPGVGRLSAATILAETGTDLSPFPTPEQLASWQGRNVPTKNCASH